ncbi:hypothetical protein EVAR_68919_1 [Eumeta japonica]|uniref:Uncharacterized protein n=1 Tax=Eumeta variegata TaxID=151549 RepID=A0A4C1T755_EUMVA|nr:hypothetical protein EVAR_68919_1 [Eumeta japonica]
MNDFLRFEDKVAEKLVRKEKQIHKRKFDRLVSLQKSELGIKFNREWFVNKTNIDIPEDVQWILSLGQKYALPLDRKRFPMMKIITEGEDIIETVQDKEEVAHL